MDLCLQEHKNWASEFKKQVAVRIEVLPLLQFDRTIGRINWSKTTMIDPLHPF